MRNNYIEVICNSITSSLELHKKYKAKQYQNIFPVKDNYLIIYDDLEQIIDILPREKFLTVKKFREKRLIQIL